MKVGDGERAGVDGVGDFEVAGGVVMAGVALEIETLGEAVSSRGKKMRLALEKLRL